MSDKPRESDRLSGEIRAEAERIDHKVKIGLLAASALALVLLLVAALGENIFATWRSLRGDYAVILEEKAEDDFGRNLAGAFGLEIEQVVMPDTGAIDRCITCHTGLDDPRMKDQPQPYTTHPGDYLLAHDRARFGCVTCHDGQGRATEKVDAHGRAPFWDHPLLPKRFMKSNCGRCHADADLYGPPRLITRLDTDERPAVSTALLDQGRRLLEGRGCQGCHKISGQGGVLGPDLTRVGFKSPHEFDFSHLGHDHPHTVYSWLKTHFDDPQAVVPTSQMPDFQLSEAETEALIAVVLSLRRDADARPPAPRLTTDIERTGGQLYASRCSACHGAHGEGSLVAGIRTPSLSNDDVLGVLDDQYLRQIIASGRSGTAMPAWGDGNLGADEIERIVGHIRSWESAPANAVEVQASFGDPAIGRAYYEGLCANCHGDNGEGGIGISLISAEFQAIASDQFLAETIINGRPGTAMPSWKLLPAQGVADIVSFIRTWRAEAPTYTEVEAARRGAPRARLAAQGEQIYSRRCAACHGGDGEGGIGPSLATPDLLRLVSNRFLYRSIVEGRPDSAMPSWRHLSAVDVAALITHLRSWQQGDRIRPPAAPPTGDQLAGQVYYELSCQRCHGARGEGGTGPRLAGRSFQDAISDRVLFRWIGYGRAGTAMKGFLPASQGPTSLKPDQIADVIAYLRYLGNGSDIPLVRVGEGLAPRGAEIFGGNCAACHGHDGEGASGPQLNNATFLRSASDGFLAATMVLGRGGTPMRSMVHGRQGLAQIAPEEIPDVVAFLRLWDGDTVPRRPRLQVEMTDSAISSGRNMFSHYCAGCHGANGRGVLDGPDHYAPALNNPEFLAAASDGFLLATIARGRRGTPMRPFGEGAGGIVSLDSQLISDIVSYLRSWQ